MYVANNSPLPFAMLIKITNTNPKKCFFFQFSFPSQLMKNALTSIPLQLAASVRRMVSTGNIEIRNIQ